MENTLCLKEGGILLGPWGCLGSSQWCCLPESGIREILIHHGRAISTIKFTDGDEYEYDDDGGRDDDDYKYCVGGNGLGNEYKVDKFHINWPKEYLTSISGYFGNISPSGPMVIKSLCFYTNMKKCGPLGSETGTFFSCPMQGGVIYGFHGRAGDFVDSIGVFVKPLFPYCPPIQESAGVTKNPTMKAIEPREAGPWGGRGGKPWDDGVFSAIKQVYVYVENGIVRAMLVQYEKRGGVSVWSESRGRPSNGSKPNKVILAEGELLVGIAGFYGEIECNGGLEALRSITFYSSKGVYGPYGDEIGTYFRSSVYSGKVVAFHGRSGLNIDAIGVHMRYF